MENVLTMKDLLSNQDKRYLIILEKLYRGESYTYQELGNNLRVSSNTIREDKKKINKFIKPAQILFNSDKKMYLQMNDNISIDFIYSVIIKNSLELNILEMIFFEEQILLEDYAEQNFISISTLKRIIAKMNKVLQTKSVYISTNPVQLRGDENRICFMMFHLFREKYIDFKYPFQEIDTLTFNELLKGIIKNSSDFLNFQDMERLKLLILVSIVRVKNNHYITDCYDNFELEKYNLDFIHNDLYKYYFKSTFQIDLTHENLIELAYFFLPNNFAIEYQELLKICEVNAEQKVKLNEHINLIEDISSSLDIPLISKEKLITDLFNIRLLKSPQDYFFYNAKLEFFTELSRESPFVLNYLNMKIKENFLVTKLTEYERIHFIYMIITHWDNLFVEIQKRQPVFNVGVFMTSDKEHSTFIAKMLNEKFYKKINFFPIKAINIEECLEQFNQYEFIVTNTTQINILSHKLINIGLFPSYNDLTTINSVYSEIITSKKTIQS
ncbi:helix-turn-helix domain-containing protein [Vagococcus fluvialis]|uniref:Helix-turn-helix domain-containing protein n=1 Tax=Vagococcus fluvialis TaxID=2738 RepID=A0A7X6I429_9ENTE|nr:helix-turn-helix domain-containing protein [Vagococcus fluvialis]NKC68424.1 helix-turn-helix domain-containing protein [Vagococcus fluvialis]